MCARDTDRVPMTSDVKFMKKFVIPLLAICMIGGFLIIMRVDVPFSVVRIQKQFKSGQTTAEVAEIIKTARIQPDICWWIIEGKEKPILSEKGDYEFPFDKITSSEKGGNFRMHLGYVGPGFLKNDFEIKFNISGNVVSVSDVKRWD